MFYCLGYVKGNKAFGKKKFLVIFLKSETKKFGWWN